MTTIDATHTLAELVTVKGVISRSRVVSSSVGRCCAGSCTCLPVASWMSSAAVSDPVSRAFGVGVGLGCADGGPDRGDVFGANDVVEGTGEVGVSVSDQETAPSQVFSGPYREVAGWLGDPDAGRVRRGAGEVDPSVSSSMKNRT